MRSPRFPRALANDRGAEWLCRGWWSTGVGIGERRVVSRACRTIARLAGWRCRRILCSPANSPTAAVRAVRGRGLHSAAPPRHPETEPMAGTENLAVLMPGHPLSPAPYRFAMRFHPTRGGISLHSEPGELDAIDHRCQHRLLRGPEHAAASCSWGLGSEQLSLLSSIHATYRPLRGTWPVWVVGVDELAGGGRVGVGF